MKKIICSNFLFISLSILVLSSCTKPEGEGGTSTVSGKVYAMDYNNSGSLIGEYYLEDEDVFIIYGEGDNYYDDDYKTSFDGSFRFQYLSKGTYTVFVYSDCVSCPSGVETISQTFEITSNNSDVVLDDFVVRK
ncbi:MAG: hypothetical protein KBF73_02620 [Flavobacteriales bacterium]|nr:hypothetical protein [Flavobacteriales bacterium]